MVSGWIGCGSMGAGMAERLVRAGYRIYVYNRTASKTEQVLAAGDAERLASPALIAEKCDIIFTSITNDAAMKEILEGEEGLLKNARTGQILVEMSTLSPAFSEELKSTLQKKGIKYLNAPVIGSMFMAREGLLKIIVSGDQEAYDTVLPYLEKIGKHTIYLGSDAQARYMKIAVNMMICSYLTMYGEVLSAGEGMGFAWDELNRILETSLGASPMLTDKGTTLKERIWSSQTALTSTALKDLSLALDCAQKGGYALTVTAMICQYDSYMHNNPKYSSYSSFGTIGVLEDISGRIPGQYIPVAADNKTEYARALEDVLTGVTILLAGEAVAFCKKEDIDRNLALECLGTCHGASKYFKDIYKNIIDGNASDTLTLGRFRNALDIVLASGKNAGQFLPIMAVCSQQINLAVNEHGCEEGISIIL